MNKQKKPEEIFRERTGKITEMGTQVGGGGSSTMFIIVDNKFRINVSNKIVTIKVKDEVNK